MKKQRAVQHGATRIVRQPKPGINKPAPYWNGERAEKIVAARVAQRLEEKRSKRSERSKANATSTGRKTARSPVSQLRRLERNLKKRKTLAARQRISQQIKLLKRELGV